MRGFRKHPSEAADSQSSRCAARQTSTWSQLFSVLFGLSAFLLALVLLHWLAAVYPELAGWLGG